MKALLILTFAAFAAAQDTHYCPDGWTVSEFGDEKACILLGGLFERVTKRDAVYICAAHDAWLVDMDEGHGGSKNNFIKGLISDKTGQGDWGVPGMKYDDQWWIGAHVEGPHSDHNQGNWIWDHSNTTVEWYDWMKGEPNDWHSQDCLTFLKDQDIFGFGVYHWNDWSCEYAARYICEKPAQTKAKFAKLF